MFGLVKVPLLAMGLLVASATSQSLMNALAEQKNVTRFMIILQAYPHLYNLTSDPGYTILAPTDAAFNKIRSYWEGAPSDLLTKMLSYHILETKITTDSLTPGSSILASSLLNSPDLTNVTGGQKVIVTRQPDTVVITSGLSTRSTIVSPNIPVDQGVLHVIDSVLNIPVNFEPTARDAFKDLTSFAGALRHAGLAKTVQKTANVTIFAPSNAAFQRLGSAITDMSKEDLARLLSYHIVPGRVEFAATVSNGTILKSALEQQLESKRQESTESSNLHITRFNNDIFVNSAKILQTDLLVANGVVQMIDNVLSPDSAASKPDFESATQSPVLRPAGTATAVGTEAPTPFADDLPCTTGCATKTGTGNIVVPKQTTSTSTTNGAGSMYTGSPALEMGAVAVGGVLGMDMVGLI